MTMISTMLEKARKVQNLAYAPYSKFHVGCCIKTVNDKYYVGCNIENASYSLTCCAEAVAIAAMICDGEKQISDVLVIGNTKDHITPCGACRQRIREFANSNTMIHMTNQNGEINSKSLAELLPNSFGPEWLLV